LALCVLIAGAVYGSTDVRAFGAFGNGSSDDTAAIQNAINSCSSNDTITFSPGNYLVRTLYLKGQCSYSGFAGSTLTLAAPNQFIFDISQQNGIHISGLTFNGSNIGGAIIAQGFAPAQNVEIDHNDFRNVSSRAWFPSNITVVSTWGFVNSSIHENHFTNIAAGIWLTTIENVSIAANSFVDVTQGDAIYVAPNPVSFPSGDNLLISGNSGSHIANIAIEIFRPDPGNGSILTKPVIENNVFSEWTGPSAFGLSITHGDGAIIRNNRISNVSGPMQTAGIEVIVANAMIYSNDVSGSFEYGIAVQGTAAPVIAQNTVTGVSDTGVILACDQARNRCSSRNSIIAANSIQNAHLVGIKLDNDWTGSWVTRNTIVRTAGSWPDDATLWFSGVHQSPSPGPGVIDSNVVIQDSPSVPAGFWFCGVRVNSSVPGASITNNTVQSFSTTPFGSGLIDNTGNATQGWIINGNTYLNLYHAIN
jgi:hypothetical protein